MKKFYFTLVTFLFLAVANAQIVNIPDANFKAKLISLGVDTNGDGNIQTSEALAQTNLDVSNSSISSLEGIQSFTNLQTLICYFNQLNSLILSSLTNLKFLSCSSSQINNLNISGLSNLEYLDCSSNQLTVLDLNGLVNLQNLYCHYNQLTNLEVNGLVNLKILNCDNNQISNLNLNGLTNLQNLDCGANQLVNLSLNGLINLKNLVCYDNLLTGLNVFNLINLKLINCYDNQLTNLNLNSLIKLQFLYANGNQLTSLLIKNGSIADWDLEFYDNPNLTFICADEADLWLIQAKLIFYGYESTCTFDSNCNLSFETNLYDDNYFTIYPNPVDDVLNLNTKQAIEIYSLTIYNLLGQQVQTTTNPTNTVDVSSLKIGNYIVKVVTDKGVSSSKFVKE